MEIYLRQIFTMYLADISFLLICTFSVLLSFRHHLGADWRWSEDCKDEKYLKIVRLFEDRKAAVYSIHQVGPMLKYT